MESFESVLFIVPAQLGDVLLCTPAIRAARERWPRARIGVLGFEGTLALLAGNPDIDELVEMPPPSRPSWKSTLRAMWALRRHRRRWELGVVARVTDRAHLAGFVTARRRSALLVHDTGWKRRAAQHRVVYEHTHIVLNTLRLLEPWLAAPAGTSVRPPPAQPLPDALAAALRHPCVVMHVPSMWRYKQWPVEHFRSVIEALLADGVQVVVTAGPAPNDRALVEPLRTLGAEPDLLVLAGTLRLPQLRALLDHADAYLGPDTSVTHLAAAAGTPLVGVYGPSYPQVFGPWPSGHPAAQPWHKRAQRQQAGEIVLLQGPDRADRPGCVPCNRMGCAHRHDSVSDCLVRLAPERVLAELRRVLSEVRRGT
jgi:heptosyltransferase-3